MLYYHPVFNHACVAQLAEQLTRNEQVAGSNPATSSKKATPDRVLLFLLSLSGGEVFPPRGGNPATSSNSLQASRGIFPLCAGGICINAVFQRDF